MGWTPECARPGDPNCLRNFLDEGVQPPRDMKVTGKSGVTWVIPMLEYLNVRYLLSLISQLVVPSSGRNVSEQTEVRLIIPLFSVPTWELSNWHEMMVAMMVAMWWRTPNHASVHGDIVMNSIEGGVQVRHQVCETVAVDVGDLVLNVEEEVLRRTPLHEAILASEVRLSWTFCAAI